MGNILPCCKSANWAAIERTNIKRQKRFEEAKRNVDEYGQDPSEREKIRGMSLTELQKALQNEELTATQTLYAFAYYALEVNDKINCIAEFLIESFDEAKKLDKEFEKKEKPPLFGLPFSVKANFFIKGYDCCIGNARLLDNPRTKDCTFITLLRQLGAVPFCYTNVPQTLLSFACSNPVYGTTKNPYNALRTPGGSSGGEAALLAARGTAFATGGDVGGSLRIPAHFCGVTTLKPCQARFQIQQAFCGLPGIGRLGLGTGVFAHTAEELTFLLSHILGNVEYHKLVPESIPLPLNLQKMEEFERRWEAKQLRIGYNFNDGFIKPVPACARVVERCVEILRSSGQEMVYFPIPEPEKAASLLFKNIACDGGAFLKKTFSENPVDKYLKRFAFMLKIPLCIRWLLAFIFDIFCPQLAILMRAYVRTPNDVRQSQEQLDEYVQKFTEQWLASNLDLLIVPAFAFPAIPYDACSDLAAAVFETGLYNMLDYPVGCLPVDKVTSEDDKALADETQWATDWNPILKRIRYAAANSVGLPVNIQIVGLPFEDEKCLALMRILEKKLMNTKNDL
uniref:Amidase domain-containing protein n=1 Tax=Meloidogyne floridensis TaxID=298350 RepID=A0A915P933_9BILA